jgi:hypothetical protein
MKQQLDPEVEMLRLGMMHDQIVYLREQLNRLKQRESDVNTKHSAEPDGRTREDAAASEEPKITR